MKIYNNFFSGFCFFNEFSLFKEYLEDGDFVVSGFSYGSIKAFLYAKNSETRVDKLQLFSPAFFQTKDEKFKRMQLMFFKKDEDAYIKNFLENLKDKSTKSIENFFKKGSFEELDELLNFKWSKEDLKELIKKGVKIEVFLGENDKIIDSFVAKEFFKEFATVYYFKDKGHLL
ncbi:pimelyl-ACP methyl ester esterase BioV [Aliarcobacter skirrowii]|uniref:pimelyl-ACP methyl ester esterase BioV n=1 Tax=Aliarcobacter skirrowii TaxID=28200 RepID=UPI0029B2C62A|nr:pimelyl-ACP methyl ester esterase BioV [Aliarcobacter skirrowii]MDX4060158.1 pimelyl-ACP methyl ester esterase BioV [Aliarcobacter skirrowii]